MQDLFAEQNPVFKPKKLEQIRLPWTGSKRAIAPQLIDKMLEIKPNAKYFVDLFCGGCSMSFTALQYGFKVHANDMQKSLINFIEYTFDRIQRNERSEFGLFPQEWYEFVTREEFIKQKELDTPFSQFVRICYSFGNNQKDYLFSKEIEGWKHLAHNIIVFRCEKSLKEFNEMHGVNFTISNEKTVYDRRMYYAKEFRRMLKKQMPSFRGIQRLQQLQQLEQLQQLQRLQQLQQLERLERLQQLEQLQRLEQLPNLTLSSLSYDKVLITTPPEETIIYCDPPYKETGKYLEGKDFNYEAFYKWFQESPYTCFLSEYNAPFEPILEIPKMKMFNNANVEKREYAIEKLFYNGK